MLKGDVERVKPWHLPKARKGGKTPICWRKPPSKTHTTKPRNPAFNEVKQLWPAPTRNHIPLRLRSMTRPWLLFLMVCEQQRKLTWLNKPPSQFFLSASFILHWHGLLMLTAASAAHREAFTNQRTQDNRHQSAEESHRFLFVFGNKTSWLIVQEMKKLSTIDLFHYYNYNNNNKNNYNKMLIFFLFIDGSRWPV